jgi:hypothetical protein
MIEGLPMMQKYYNSFLYKSDREKFEQALEVLLPVAI